MWSVDEVPPSVRPILPEVEAALEGVWGRIAALREPPPIRFALVADPSRALPGYGFGGFCGSAGRVRLSFDMRSPNLEAHLGEALERTVAHEVHHALRWAGPGYGTRLGAALATEGLAGRFVGQLYGSPPEPWEARVPPGGLGPWRARADAAFEDAGYDHPAWFFGTGEPPHWIGYALGYDMVGRHLERHPEATALSLADAPHGIFRDALRG
ncbi:putative Zn-dependent protease DUF2268 [Hasllibacter halocynthiae]|uniref:Putative Zn-dependent protease DUF2268 n=1 Tax=Hasllibacter halocynthiae TaxID=595589 RepID=A0A2T0X138_9RHOB|nr:DUF2268 domain-containing putative Zn-dependent protease [Hasllibacter halocynthiae]PRY92650.1 putative Zn-dependent protease DUF2268 [Hasllibacter halocynthiae]